MNTVVIIISTVIIIILLNNLTGNSNEGYNMGTIIQLNAKGPQDIYLTDDSYMYYPRHMYFGSTRMKKSDRPQYIY